MGKVILVFALLMSGCSITKSDFDIKKEALEEDVTILKLELRKLRLEKQIAEEEKSY
jgi:hypothetical protein